MLERLTRESPDQAISVLKDGMPNLTDEGNVTALTAAASRILPQLCGAGHITEAVQLLDRVQDCGAWRESFQAVLPYWMDADPAAARTAFEVAPLTALERERWQQHPAFLLHLWQHTGSGGLRPPFSISAKGAFQSEWKSGLQNFFQWWLQTATPSG